MAENELSIPLSLPSFEQICDAISEAKYGLSLLSLNMFCLKWNEYFQIAIDVRSTASSVVQIRNAITSYRIQHEALEDGPAYEYIRKDELIMKEKLRELFKGLHEITAPSVAESIVAWLHHSSRLRREGGFGMVWSYLLFALRDRETSVVLNQLGISQDAVKMLASKGHTYYQLFEEIEIVIECLQHSDLSDWDRQEFQLYQGGAGADGNSLLTPFGEYRRAAKREELLKEIDVMLDSQEKAAFRQWAEAMVLGNMHMSIKYLNPPTLYSL